MGVKYEDKLNEITRIMFKVSQYLYNTFSFSMVAENKCDKEKTIKEILKAQKRCYKMIEKYNLNDYKDGNHDLYTDVSVNTYKPNSDKQKVLDLIDYFFLNNGYENAKEFLKVVSPIVHEHEIKSSLSLENNVSKIQPKRFYNADCWQEFIKQGLLDTNILDAHILLSQEKIKEINNKYSHMTKLNNEFCKIES